MLTTLAIVAGYLVCIGATHQLAEPLSSGRYDGGSFRTWASCLWPVTACVATGVAIARLLQGAPTVIRRAARRRAQIPTAVAQDRLEDASRYRNITGD